MLSPQDFIHGMPKCELHVHLEGTLEAEMKFVLAERNGIELPYADAASLKAAYAFHDLQSFLKVYYEGMQVLLTEQDFYEICYAYLKKARSQNILYAEMFFDPQAHTSRGVAFDSIVRGIHQAQVDADRELGIRSQLIMCFLRELSAEDAMSTLQQSLPYKDWIVGVGLDSDERGNPPAKFLSVFSRARQEGYRLTMHCDVNQENTHEHIRQAIAEVGVERVDHGVNLLDDPALIALARARDLSFTLCPFANQSVLLRDAQQPVRRMLDLGLRVTINSDDPAYMQGLYLAENFGMAQRELSLSNAELHTLARNAFEAAWLPRSDRNHYLATLDDFAQSALATT